MEIRVRERCKVEQDWMHTYPFANCEDCGGTGYIESWVEIPYTLEEFREQLSFLRTGRAIQYDSI